MTKKMNKRRVFRFVTPAGLEGTLEVIGNRVVLSNQEQGKKVVYQGPGAKQAFADLSRELVRRGEAIEISARTSVKA